MSHGRRAFEEKKKHMTANSISTSLLNESFDAFKSLKNANTIEDEGKFTHTLLIPHYNNSRMTNMSESWISPSKAFTQTSVREMQNKKSPLYSLNWNNKARVDKYKSHLLKKYQMQCEWSNSANHTVTDRQGHSVSYLQEANFNLMHDNDLLTTELW